jgi:hypothetical protein
MCEWDAPEGHSGQCCEHQYAFLSYRHLSPQFQFSLSAVALGIYMYLCVAGSCDCPEEEKDRLAADRAGNDRHRAGHQVLPQGAFFPRLSSF